MEVKPVALVKHNQRQEQEGHGHTQLTIASERQIGLAKAVGGQVGSIGLVNRASQGRKVQRPSTKGADGARRSAQIERPGYAASSGEQDTKLRSSRLGYRHDEVAVWRCSLAASKSFAATGAISFMRVFLERRRDASRAHELSGRPGDGDDEKGNKRREPKTSRRVTVSPTPKRSVC